MLGYNRSFNQGKQPTSVTYCNDARPHENQVITDLGNKEGNPCVTMVRDTRVELVSSVWKTDILADVRIPR